MKLARRASHPPPISLVSMIDVLMILVIFFMVTSTYLQLRMLPLAGRPDGVARPTAAAEPTALLFVHLSADGGIRVGGRPIGAGDLAAEILRRRAAEPGLSVVVLPSGRARTQVLATVMDVAADTGVTRLQILDPAVDP
jgi:biopolymer transport protein ExbD